VLTREQYRDIRMMFRTQRPDVDASASAPQTSSSGQTRTPGQIEPAGQANATAGGATESLHLASFEQVIGGGDAATSVVKYPRHLEGYRDLPPGPANP
jgi:hypothetical protein